MTLLASSFVVSGVAFLIPVLISERGLTLTQAGTVASMPLIGTMLTLFASIVLAQDGIEPHSPRSTGALEEFFRQLENTIAGRASRMTNKNRTDALLRLIAARRNRWLNETAWAELIRDHLARSHGRAPDQRRHVDSRSAPSLPPTPR